MESFKAAECEAAPLTHGQDCGCSPAARWIGCWGRSSRLPAGEPTRGVIKQDRDPWHRSKHPVIKSCGPPCTSAPRHSCQQTRNSDDCRNGRHSGAGSQGHLPAASGCGSPPPSPQCSATRRSAALSDPLCSTSAHRHEHASSACQTGDDQCCGLLNTVSPRYSQDQSAERGMTHIAQ